MLVFLGLGMGTGLELPGELSPAVNETGPTVRGTVGATKQARVVFRATLLVRHNTQDQGDQSHLNSYAVGWIRRIPCSSSDTDRKILKPRELGEGTEML
jgi:hypothetical protein